MFVFDVRSACSTLVTKLQERLVCTIPMLLASWAMGGFPNVSTGTPKPDPERTIMDSESPHPVGIAQRLSIGFSSAVGLWLTPQKGTLAKTGVAFLASCATAAVQSQ